MDEDGTSITDVTECSTDDLDNCVQDPEMSSQLAVTDTSDDGNITASHSSVHKKTFEADTGGSLNTLNEDEDSGKEEKARERTHSGYLPNKSPSPTPIESFARGAKLTTGVSYSSCIGQDAAHKSRQAKYGVNHTGTPKRSPVFQQELTGKWYDNPCFDHYWRHYHFVSAWCQKHMEVYRAVVTEHVKESTKQASLRVGSQWSVPQKAKWQSDSHTSKRTLRNRKARKRRKLAKQRMRLALAQAEGAEGYSSLTSSDEQGKEAEVPSSAEGEELEETIVMEISDEMLDFFAHTLKHRLERDAKKKNKTEKGGKHVNIEDIQGEQKMRTSEAPKEQPGAQRSKEILLLYGKGAPMIHGMETALQMNFDRNIDILQPKLWPNMPFKIVFD